MFHFKTKKDLIRFVIIAGIILLIILIAVLTPILFKGTAFAQVVENSIGKFFNIVKFFTDHYVDLIETATIIIFMWVLSQVLKFLITILTNKKNRSITIAHLLISIVKYSALIVTVFLILSAWGVQTPTLLASAGILGLAISFGAQNLIEDILAGLFIIFEKQFSVGDVIQIDAFRGTVIEIGIRTTKFEDINGDIKIINNSDIRGAINTSSDLSPVICDVSIAYGEDLERVEKVINAHLADMKKAIPNLEEGPFYRGVQSLSDSAVIIRMYAKSEESKKYQAGRDMNRYMKILLDKNNIQIPFPQIVVHMEEKEKEESK
ncbi:MAG: mechanosensitive ion channel family protein [Bacilli bacterium]|nr:mechanosensitive ion channel family protein [Bacilli bacterium]